LGLKLALLASAFIPLGALAMEPTMRGSRTHFYASPRNIAQILTDIQDPELDGE
jgi:hypothetical protein